MTEYKRLTSSKGVIEYCCSLNCDEDCLNCYFCKVSERLVELEDKIENGTLVELPCKVGDIVYVPASRKMGKGADRRSVIGVYMHKVESILFYDGRIIYDCGNCYRFQGDWVGKFIFLTREEAEKWNEEFWRKHGNDT